MKSTADFTQLLLLQKHGSPSLQESASTILKALYEQEEAVKPLPQEEAPIIIQKATQPLIEPPTHSSVEELATDVLLRCKAAGCSKKATTQILKAMIAKYEQGEFQ